MNLTKAEQQEAGKFFWLFEYIDRSEKLNQFLWGKGLDVWLADAPLCLDSILLTEPFRENLPPNCRDEINVVIESRDRALKKFLADLFAPAVARDTIHNLPEFLKTHRFFENLLSATTDDPDKANLFLISNWVVLNAIAKTEDGPMLVPGLAFHTDESRAADTTRQAARNTAIIYSADTIRKRWERLGLVSVSKEKMPNLAAFIGTKMSMRPIKSKKRSP